MYFDRFCITGPSKRLKKTMTGSMVLMTVLQGSKLKRYVFQAFFILRLKYAKKF